MGRHWGVLEGGSGVSVRAIGGTGWHWGGCEG